LTIRDEFLKWTKARVNGELKTLKGLVRRRTEEYNLYAQI
jgi:GH24 family phage-related lysozyme (muramidase)